MANGKIKIIPKIKIPSNAEIEFFQNGGEFGIDWRIGQEIYRLSWSTTYIAYTAYVNGAWYTLWTK